MKSESEDLAMPLATEGTQEFAAAVMKYDIHEFDEIRPYEPEEMRQAFEDLLNDRQFSLMMKGFVPWLPKGIRNALLRLSFMGVKTPLDFQKRFMKPIVRYIIRKYTDGCTFDDHMLFTVDGLQFTDDYSAVGGGLASKSTVNCKPSTVNQRFTFISNHRDIVLDSAFLDLKLVENHYPTTVEIGIGDNLLIYPWIKRLVRMNKAFTVRRGLSLRETLAASQLMSRYIHFAVTQKKENIWLAQREGRAKDSDDRTQEAVLKMLAMGGDLKELNIVPLTISYEYDPCDYLKAQEFQQKRDNPGFKKSRQDDLDNMKTGLFGYKGRVVYRTAAPLDTWLEELADLPKNEYYKAVAERMDQEIHQGYELFPCNYIALDELNGDSANASHYTGADKQRFEQYLSGQIAKITLANKDEAYLRERILTMYANPARNKGKSK